MGLGSSHEETSKGWQALKVLVAAQGPVPVLAVGTFEPQQELEGPQVATEGRRGNVFPVPLDMDFSEAF